MKKIFLSKQLFYFLQIVFVLSLIQCKNDEEMQIKNGQNTTEKPSIKPDDSQKDNLKIYTLPAPLQIATAVKNLNLNYSGNLLVPANQSTTTLPNNYLKALNLGVFGIDLGYSTIYEKHQPAIYYLSKIQKLSDELGIIGGFRPATLERFKNNIKNQDSLYYIILETFNDCHKYLKENDRNDIGLLILTGSYIEGLYVAASKTINNYNTRTANLIARQQIFLDNLIELLTEYTADEEIAELIEQLKQLKENYKGVDVKENENLTSAGNSKPEISLEQIKKITQKISEIRMKIIS